MDKKTIIGIVLIVLIILLTPIYQKWVVGTVSTPQSSADSLSAAQTAITSSGDSVRPIQAIAEPETTMSAQKENKQSEDSTLLKIPVMNIVVVSDKFTVKLSTLGGDVKSIRLHKIYDSEGNEVELVPNLAGGPNFEFIGTLGGRNFSTAGVRFVADRDTIFLDEDNQKDAVTMIGKTPDGIMIQRRYEFEYGKYHFRHKILVSSQDSSQSIGDCALWWKSGLIPTEKNTVWDLREFAANYRVGDEFDKFKPSKKKPSFSLDGATDWVGTRSKYFFVAVMPDKILSSNGVRANTIWLRKEGVDKEIPIVQVGLYERCGEPVFSRSYLVYAGPRDYFILKRYGRMLAKSVSLGWWWLAPITQFILWLLKMIYAVIPNYGWVIIIFTILMKLLLLPIAHTQMKSMKRMKGLQPQMRSIQERFRDDPQKMNAEIMKLYRKHGVSPLSGCLPLLVQMPIFFALYRALAGGFQFRAQPFIFWIKDLSQRDPYFVLPIIMAISMFVQQKITVTDPKQKSMAYIMPIIFLFFFYNLPAGLVLYWTTFNILSGAHMLWVEHKWKEATTLTESEENAELEKTAEK